MHLSLCSSGGSSDCDRLSRSCGRRACSGQLIKGEVGRVLLLHWGLGRYLFHFSFGGYIRHPSYNVFISRQRDGRSCSEGVSLCVVLSISTDILPDTPDLSGDLSFSLSFSPTHSPAAVPAAAAVAAAATTPVPAAVTAVAAVAASVTATPAPRPTPPPPTIPPPMPTPTPTPASTSCSDEVARSLARSPRPRISDPEEEAVFRAGFLSPPSRTRAWISSLRKRTSQLARLSVYAAERRKSVTGPAQVSAPAQQHTVNPRLSLRPFLPRSTS